MKRTRWALTSVAALAAVIATTILGGPAVASYGPPSGAGNVNVGPGEFLYSNESMPISHIDGSMATLRRDANSYFFFHSYGGLSAIQRYWGPAEDPLQNRMADGTIDMNGRDGAAWLMNIYAVSSTTYLGFAHVESNDVPGWGCTAWDCDFTLGLLYSTDSGATWEYLGDIAQPQVNGPSSDYNNAGGVPYVVVGDYFYVYFNDWNAAGQKNLGVARALIADVLTAATSGTVSPWKKYVGGAWTGDAFTSFADNIIPLSANTGTGQQPDLHSDAAYSSALGKYLITVQTHQKGNLLLFTSTDGVSWGEETIIDQTDANNYIHAYSFFLDTGYNSVDSHIVGADFELYYPLKNWPAVGDYDEFFKRRITIGQSPAEIFVASDSFTANTQGVGNWRAQQAVGTTYTDMTWDATNLRWRGTAFYSIVSDYWMHTNPGADSVRTWVAPRAGVVRVEGDIRKWLPGGDGVTARILKNGVQVWPASGGTLISGSDTVGFDYDLHLTVAAGDSIQFRLNGNTTNDFDTTYWDPSIAYSTQAQLGFDQNSPAQGENGWSYLEGTSSGVTPMTWDAPNSRWTGTAPFALVMGSAQHPDVNDSIRRWTATTAGSITIAGTVAKAPNGVGGDGVRVKILKNGTQIWPASGWASIGGTDLVGLTHNITTTVAPGDTISFVVNRNSTVLLDTTSWNPQISY